MLNGVKFSVSDTVLVEHVDSKDSRHHWVATIEGFWQDIYGEKWADARWFYFPEHAKYANMTGQVDENEVFASSHVDEVPIDLIRGKCVVLSEDEWQARMESDQDDMPTYLCRKHYSCDTGEFRPLLKDLAQKGQVS